jgi:hypothetical protein
MPPKTRPVTMEDALDEQFAKPTCNCKNKKICRCKPKINIKKKIKKN